MYRRPVKKPESVDSERVLHELRTIPSSELCDLRNVPMYNGAVYIYQERYARILYPKSKLAGHLAALEFHQQQYKQVGSKGSDDGA